MYYNYYLSRISHVNEARKGIFKRLAPVTYWTYMIENSCLLLVSIVAEGDNKKEREHELKTMMKRLEAKYAALQVVPVISKLGTPEVSCVSQWCKVSVVAMFDLFAAMRHRS